MKQVITVLAIALFCTTISAQDFKFGKVSKEELEEKVHPLDSSANAAVLYKSEKIKFDYMQGLGFRQKSHAI